MINAKKELLEKLEELERVETNIECIKIIYDRSEISKTNKTFILKKGFTKSDYEIFLSQLDFNYDNDYGGQKLFGTVWFKDKTWLERKEYESSEWWEHKERPIIPKDLI